MKVYLTGKVMDVISKDYEFNGKSGTSHKVVIYEDGALNNVVIQENQKDEFIGLIGTDVELQCTIFVKGSYNLKLV